MALLAVTVNVAMAPSTTPRLAGCATMATGLNTVSTAARLVTLPPPLLTTTRTCRPLSARVTSLSASVAVLPPLMSAQLVPPSLLPCQRYAGVAPRAVTLKSTSPPVATATSCGCVAMPAGTSTVSVAAVLVAVLPLPETTTRNCAPSWARLATKV